MTAKHLAAIVRMQWQIRRNQFRRSTQGNRLLTYFLFTIGVLGSLGSFIMAVGAGKFFLARVEPAEMIYVWDVLVGVFLFAWAMGVMIELQRSEMLSLKNLLHLPVSLSGAFFLNYASSLASLTILMFVPGMLGLCFASVLRFGAASLVAFALLASFLLMVTAVFYQLRGWIARLMENKRTRGTVIAITTISFILIFQIPNLINMKNMGSWNAERAEHRAAHDTLVADLKSKFEAGEISSDSFVSSKKLARESLKQRRKSDRNTKTAATKRVFRIVNLGLPIGWLPYGASAAAGGAILTPWLCVLGMSTIGLSSLALSYRSTIRDYIGDRNKTHRSFERTRAPTANKGSLLEKSVPFLRETQSVIALATLQSTLRAPEAKMALVTPVIFVCVFGSMMFTGPLSSVPEIAKPFLSVGAITVSVFGTAQLLLNIFGLDRQGFRAYVLMPTPRRDILLGKNMGVFPLVLVLSVPLVVFAGIAAKLQFSHAVASVLQVGVAFMLFFPIANYTSIAAPMGISSGTMKPVSMNFSVVLKQLVAMLLISLITLPAMFALAAELLANSFSVMNGVPIYLSLTLLQLPIAVWFYRKMLDIQGPYLHRREHIILEVISRVDD